MQKVNTNLSTSNEEWNIVQSVMSDLAAERFLENQDDAIDFEKMKMIVAETYLQQKGIHLSSEKLDALFKKYEKQENLPVIIEKDKNQESFSNKKNIIEETKTKRIKSLFKSFEYQKIALFFLGRYIRIKPNYKYLADHIPLDDEDVVEEAEEILNMDRSGLVLTFTLGFLIFFTGGMIYLLSSIKILLIISLLGIILTSLSSISGLIIHKNKRKMKRGLEDWNADWRDTNACAEMLKMISPLNEIRFLSDKDEFPNYTPLTKTELKSFMTYSSSDRIKILNQWIKTGKTIRQYDKELIKTI